MNRKINRGSRVRVRPFRDIIKTLDSQGKFDRMPFMPEMVQYCGKEFTVLKKANYICVDVAGMRALNRVVVLQDVHCDGSAHDNCRKACLIFWKEEWLVPVDEENTAPCKKAEIIPVDFSFEVKNHETGQYLCQSSQLARASNPVEGMKKIRLLLKEAVSANRAYMDFGRDLLRFVHYKLGSSATNSFCRSVAGDLIDTPSERLNLQPGDIVEVKGLDEIRSTLDRNGCNRGLMFTPEMHHFCGHRYRVLQRLDKMISESDGRMVNLNDTVLLENVACMGICKLGCARHLYHYWREIWLRRV